MKYCVICLFLILGLTGCYQGFEEPPVLQINSGSKFVRDFIIFPNPLSQREILYVDYELSDSCYLNMTIRNLTGDVVKTVSKSEKNIKGKHETGIELRNDDKQPLKPGIYALVIILDSDDSRKTLFEIK